VLFIAGELSDFVKPEDINALFPTARLVSVAGAGHWLHVQQPEVFIAQVRDFLQQDKT
jgi:esterase